MKSFRLRCGVARQPWSLSRFGRARGRSLKKLPTLDPCSISFNLMMREAGENSYMRAKTALLVILTAAVVFLAHPRSAAAGEPTEQIRVAVNQGVEILNKARLDNAAGKAETIARLKKVVYPLFDFDEMARRSLGAYWRSLNPAQQKEFVAVFTELLEKTYAKNIDLYDGSGSPTPAKRSTRTTPTFRRSFSARRAKATPSLTGFTSSTAGGAFTTSLPKGSASSTTTAHSSTA